MGGKKRKSCKFAIGLPQGLPQSYFLANLLMVEIEKFYKNVLPGEMVFYVDDSAIFTNEIKNIEDFGQKIETINEKISKWMNDLYEQSNDFIPSELRSFVAENIDLYGIKIHPAGDKSTISNITDGKRVKCIFIVLAVKLLRQHLISIRVFLMRKVKYCLIKQNVF